MTEKSKTKTVLARCGGTLLLIFLSFLCGGGESTALNVVAFLFASGAAVALTSFSYAVPIASCLLGFTANMLFFRSELIAIMCLYPIPVTVAAVLVKKGKLRRQSAVMGAAMLDCGAYFASFVYFVYMKMGDFSLETAAHAFSGFTSQIEKYVDELLKVGETTLTSRESIVQLILCLLPAGILAMIYLIVLGSFSIGFYFGREEHGEGWRYENNIVTAAVAVIILIVNFFIGSNKIFVALITFAVIPILPLVIEGFQSVTERDPLGHRNVKRIVFLIIAFIFVPTFAIFLAMLYGISDTVKRFVKEIKPHNPFDGENKQ